MSGLLANIQWAELAVALGETLAMVLSSTLFATLVGLPLGVLLVLTGPDHLLPRPAAHRLLSAAVNALRSTPFIILMILCTPLTKALVGTSLGPRAAVVPLVVGAAPFFARLVEVALREVERGAIDMGLSCGAGTWQLIWHILLPEARAGILAGVTITAVALVGYSAMAGVVGGGGLGDLAIRYGYQRFQTDVMLLTTAVLVVLVQIFQGIGDTLVKHFSRK
ncbi:MAG TPA: methionine ABC transporter permease [Myxococcota bacterium]|nr:methionine ABC transporter permease [Myxococcota bacterium]